MKKVNWKRILPSREGLETIASFLRFLGIASSITILVITLLAAVIMIGFLIGQHTMSGAAVFYSAVILITSLWGAWLVKENKPVAQTPRWLFFVGSLIFIGSLSYFLSDLILQTVFKEFTGFWSVAVKSVVSIFIVSFTVEEGHKYFLFRIGSNEFAAANDIFFGRTGSTGMKVVRIFFGGLNAKFPWEDIEVVDDLNKDTIIEWSFTGEFTDATGTIRGTRSLRPNKDRLQQFLATSKDPDERKAILVKVFTAAIKMILGDLLRGIAIKDAMGTKKALCEQVEERGAEILSRLEAAYGVYSNTMLIADIDFTEEVKNAFEQQAVNENLMKTAAMYLRKLGYTQDQIDGKEGTTPVSFDHWRWATDMAKETAGEIKRTVFDVRGFEGGGGATGALATGMLANSIKGDGAGKGGKK